MNTKDHKSNAPLQVLIEVSAIKTCPNCQLGLECPEFEFCSKTLYATAVVRKPLFVVLKGNIWRPHKLIFDHLSKFQCLLSYIT
jgi:hypothetical protein